MVRFFPVLIVGLALASASSFAQTPAPPAAPAAPAPTETPQAAPPRNEDRLAGFAENRVADVIDVRIAQAKADLRLTPEQDQNWSAFQGAARNYGVADARRRFLWAERLGDVRSRDDMRRDDMRRSNMQHRDDIALMRAEADDMAARANDMRSVIDALEPLYRSLDERQQIRLSRFVGRLFSSR
jgi:hypothetical protein